MLKAIRKKFRYGEKGFTLIELLVVVAILGALAAVAIPNVGKFIGEGKTESYDTELSNVQTAVMAMMVESDTGKLDGGTGVETDDMDTVTAPYGGVASAIKLSDYMTGLDADGKVKSGCKYTFTADGDITQTLP